MYPQICNNLKMMIHFCHNWVKMFHTWPEMDDNMGGNGGYTPMGTPMAWNLEKKSVQKLHAGLTQPRCLSSEYYYYCNFFSPATWKQWNLYGTLKPTLLTHRASLYFLLARNVFNYMGTPRLGILTFPGKKLGKPSLFYSREDGRRWRIASTFCSLAQSLGKDWWPTDWRRGWFRQWQTICKNELVNHLSLLLHPWKRMLEFQFGKKLSQIFLCTVTSPPPPPTWPTNSFESLKWQPAPYAHN